MKKVYHTPLFKPPGYHIPNYEIRLLRLEECYEILFNESHATNIKNTPHFKYATGNPKPLKDYFARCKGHTWGRAGTDAENMTVDELCLEFDALLNTEKGYLEPPFEGHYIIVNQDKQLIDELVKEVTSNDINLNVQL